MTTPTDDATILTHSHAGTNVLGLIWAVVGLLPASLLMVVVELPQILAASLLVGMLALSIVLDFRWRAGSIPAVGYRRFFHLSSGGCLLWMPYWLTWFVVTPVVFLFSRFGILQNLKALLEGLGYYR